MIIKCCPYCKSTEIRVYDPSEVKDKLGKFNCCWCNEDFMKPITKEVKEIEDGRLYFSKDILKYYHYSNLPNIDFLNTLYNSNMIFLCHNKVEWYNNYPINKYDNNLIRFMSETITNENTMIFNNLEEYHSLWDIDGYDEDEDKPKNYIYSDRLKELISQGYICFKLDVENIDSELSELFVIDPTSNLIMLIENEPIDGNLHSDYLKWLDTLKENQNKGG